jgi:signal transduction histidine kinase/CheY-like chemotaxis protein
MPDIPYMPEQSKASSNPGLDAFLAFLMIAIVVLADWATGVKMSFSLFYLGPIAFIAWRWGLVPGLAVALLCVAARLATDTIGGKEYPSLFVGFWNNGVRSGIMIFTAIVMSRIRSAMRLADQSREEALAASRAKSDFLWSMSHEIRTPLNAILGMAEVLAETPLDEEQAGYVRIFRSEGRSLLALINDLLDGAKVEAGKFFAERIAFPLPELLGEIGSEAGAQVRRKGLGFSLETAPDIPPRMLGDPLLIRRTLLNLAGNSAKFTQAGSIAIKVQRDPADPQGKIVFSVADTGIGIPQDRLDRLFLPFSQAEDSTQRQYGGTGLGLSLCKRFVELMGGTISVASRSGEGSVFSFVLPLETPPEGDAVPIAEERDYGKLTVERPLRILLVDDHEVNRELVKVFLERTPYLVDEASDGEAGVAKVKERDYDVVLMDMQMPVMDGHAAARAIRAWEAAQARPRLPIIALTAHASVEDRRESAASGCDAHLSKPFSKAHLLKAIRTAVGGSPGKPSPDATGRGALSVTAQRPPMDPDVEALMPKFLADLRGLIAASEESLRRGEIGAVGAIGHKIKGAGGSFGFDRVSILGGMLETSAGTGDGNALRGTLAELKAFAQEAEHDAN